MSTLPPWYQPPYTYPQPTYPLPLTAQKPALAASKPVHPVFNKDPLQPIPLKEASILAFAGGALFGVGKCQLALITGKNAMSHAKALLLSPISAFAGMLFISMPILQCVALWNFLLERKRRKALGLPPAPLWPKSSDFKEGCRAYWAGIKSLVSSSATSQ
ncbi:hypothetical protein [Vampirovibrio chlorellavorus]|uniref:hypothetical protein n=1 Tax=Vampirovibrio chlorellavorus TaxID=758823 RepID=UPI0026F1AED2|nr:hypothetical protein [Vampirovibrio chlorellavorus]